MGWKDSRENIEDICRVLIKKMKKLFNIFFFLILFIWGVFLTPVFMHGQGYQTFRSELDQIRERARWRIGPFRISSTIQFQNIGYDDNVYYQREEDSPISDYTAIVSAEATICFSFRNWLIISFSENPKYVHYEKEKRRRAFNNSYSPSLRLLVFNRFVISGDYQYQKAKLRTSSEFDAPRWAKVKRYNGSFFYETARETSFGFSGSIRKISYEDMTLPGERISLSSALNREEKNGGFEFYYRIFSESFFFINAGYTEYNFDDPQSRFRDSYSYQAYSGIRFPLLGRASGIISLGYKKLLPRSGEKQGFSGLVGNTGLDFRMGRFGFRFQYNRDARFSFMAENIYFIEDNYGAGMSFYLTQFLRLDYNFTYGEGNYPEVILLRTPDGQDEEIKRRDIYCTHSAGIVIRIIRRTGIGFRVNFWERDSNLLRASRNRMFVGGYITYEF